MLIRKQRPDLGHADLTLEEFSAERRIVHGVGLKWDASVKSFLQNKESLLTAPDGKKWHYKIIS